MFQKNFYTNLGNIRSLDFKIGRDYPEPIVNHEEARAKALDAFKKIK